MTGNHLTTHYVYYYHHGIDCGDGTVIHLSGEKSRVICTPFNDFADGRSVHIEKSQCDYSAIEVVERACSCVGKSGYDIFNNNCEHFVVWCRTGKQSSQQIKNTYKFGVKAIPKLAAKENVAFLAVDAAQFAIEQSGGIVGLSQENSKKVGRCVGLAAYVAIGACSKGPVGALEAGGVWGIGEISEIVSSLF